MEGGGLTKEALENREAPDAVVTRLTAALETVTCNGTTAESGIFFNDLLKKQFPLKTGWWKGCLPGGRFLAVEVKAPDGRLSPEQKRLLAEVEGLGGLAVVVRGWRELAQALREGLYFRWTVV